MNDDSPFLSFTIRGYSAPKRRPLLLIPEGNEEQYQSYSCRKQQGSSAVGSSWNGPAIGIRSARRSIPTLRTFSALTRRKNDETGDYHNAISHPTVLPHTAASRSTPVMINNYLRRKKQTTNAPWGRTGLDLINSIYPSIIPLSSILSKRSFLCCSVLTIGAIYLVLLLWMIIARARLHSGFPMSISQSDTAMETISFSYPEFSSSATISVPKRWIPSKWEQHSNQQQKLLKDRVGSSLGISAYYVPSKGTLLTPLYSLLSATRLSGISSSWNRRTIFVGLSTYQGLHCPGTVETIFRTAYYPERIRVGIVDFTDNQQEETPLFTSSCNTPPVPCSDQPHQILCQYADHIDVFQLHQPPNFMFGPMLVGHIVQRLYRGEYYALLANVNTVMVSGWDVDSINQWESLFNEMAILSTIPSIANERIMNMTTGKVFQNTRVVLCDATFMGETVATRILTFREKSQPELVITTTPSIHASTTTTTTTTPKLQPYWSSHFSFSKGHFLLDVPYDPYLSFVPVGEDLSISVRAFTHGYDMYTPDRPLCFSLETNFNRHQYHKINALQFPR